MAEKKKKRSLNTFLILLAVLLAVSVVTWIANGQTYTGIDEETASPAGAPCPPRRSSGRRRSPCISPPLEVVSVIQSDSRLPCNPIPHRAPSAGRPASPPARTARTLYR